MRYEFNHPGGFISVKADSPCTSLVGAKGFEWITPEIEAQMKEHAELVNEIEDALESRDVNALELARGDLLDYKQRYPNWQADRKRWHDLEQAAQEEAIHE